jgi:hypothetical protein
VTTFGEVKSDTNTTTLDAKPSPSGYLELTGPLTTVSALLVDIPGVAVTVETAVPGRVHAVMTLSTTEIGGPLGTVGGWAIQIDGVDGEQLDAGYPLSAVGSRIVVVQARSVVLAAGSHSVVGRFRRVAGTGAVSVDKVQLFGQFVG